MWFSVTYSCSGIRLSFTKVWNGKKYNRYYFVHFIEKHNMNLYVHFQGTRCSSVAEHPLLVQWVVGSIPHGGPIELFFVPASAPQLVYKGPWYVLFCLWDNAFKEPLMLIKISSTCSGGCRFLI